MKTSQFLCFGLFLVLIGPGEVIAGGGEGSACTTLPPGHAYPFSDDCKRVSSTSTCTSTDADGDGIYDVRCGGPGLEQLICDNCPDASNPTQADSDCDGIGDPCEMQCSGAREGKSEACSGLKDPPGSCHVCEKSPSGDFSYGRCDTAFCTPP
ncbi:MAG: hypothetical protein Q7T11_00780, partial [Deltaproteobacteria bacterium]|nr:hypothetical protein [Deltaproteobacteria bacterium]